MTHVLLPVSLLLRRAYAAEVIWAVLKAKAAGGGYRRIAAAVGIPACTVRRWLRVMGRRAEAVRQWFLGVAVAAGVDVSIPAATGTAVGDVLAAVGAARLAMVSRFGCGVGGAAARGCRIGPLFDDRSAIDRRPVRGARCPPARQACVSTEIRE